MKTIRIGNDVNISWSLYTRFGGKYSLVNKTVSLWLLSGPFKKELTSFYIKSGNEVAASIDKNELRRCGVYRLLLRVRDNNALIDEAAYDFTQLFQIVTRTYTEFNGCEVLDGAVDLKFKSILNIQTEVVSDGAGESAYQIAVRNGFDGTEAEWLESLKGNPGESLYEIAVRNGFTGTEQEWLDSIMGSASGIHIYTAPPITTSLGPLGPISPNDGPMVQPGGSSGSGTLIFSKALFSGDPKTGDVALRFTDYGTLFAYRLTVDGSSITASYPEDVILDDFVLFQPVDVVDNLASRDSQKALSANMGRHLLNLINNITAYTLPSASQADLGGVKLGYPQNNKNYPLKLDTLKRAYVTVPWEGGGGSGSGTDGGHWEQAFRATSANNTPSLPTNGVELDTANSGWNYYAPNNSTGTLVVWMAVRWIDGNGQYNEWQGPWRISGPQGVQGAPGEAGIDGDKYEYIYARTTGEDVNPPAISSIPSASSVGLTPSDDDFVPAGWSDSPVGVTTSLRVEWMCLREKTFTKQKPLGEWSTFAGPFPWSVYGRQGLDGDGVEYIFYAGMSYPSEEPDSWSPTSYDFQHTKEYVKPGSGWVDDPVDLSTIGQGAKQWVSIRKRYVGAGQTEPTWHAYSAPALWSYYPFDGDAGIGVVADFDNDTMPVPIKQNGYNYAFTQTAKATMYNGGPVLSSTITALSVEDSSGNDYTSEGWVTYDQVLGENIISVDLPEDEINLQDTALKVKVTLTATLNSVSVSRTVNIQIFGVNFGVDGLSYNLVVNTPVIKVDKFGTRTPSSITPTVTKSVGGTISTYTPTTVSTADPLLSFRYSVDDDEEITLSGNSISTNDVLTNLRVELDYNGTMIDQETILVIEDGADGSDGSAGQQILHSHVYRRSASKPSTPGNSTTKVTGGVDDVTDPVTGDPININYGGEFGDPIPALWSDGIPPVTGDAVNDRLWHSFRVFTDDGLLPQGAGWSEPVEVTDTTDFDIEFARMQTNDLPPVVPDDDNRHGGMNAQVWFDPTLDSSVDFTEMYWAATRKLVNGTWSAWKIVRIKGEKGEKGDKGDEGERGAAGITGLPGKDARPIRIRDWSSVYGKTLASAYKIFSGFEEEAPFRDVLVVTKADYAGTPIGYPFTDGEFEIPTLITPVYDVNYPNGLNGNEITLPHGGAEINYTESLPPDEEVAEMLVDAGVQWSVFQKLGAIYVQLLAATQAYIGELTVNNMTTRNAISQSYIEIDDGFIRVYDPAGVLRIEIGQGSGDSDPVIKFYDENGDLLYDLGPGGIRWAADGWNYDDCTFGERVVLGRICSAGDTVASVSTGGSAADIRHEFYEFHPATRSKLGETTQYYNYDQKLGDGISNHGWVSMATITPFFDLLVRTNSTYSLRPNGATSEMDVWPQTQTSLLVDKLADGWYMDNTGGFLSNYRGTLSAGDSNEE